MNAERPDQAKFDSFASVFTKIDDHLKYFCQQNCFRLDKNLHRQPCRVMRTGSNPEYIIEICLIENWFMSEFNENLHYSFGCCAYYTPPGDNKFLWKLQTQMLESASFQIVQQELHEQLPVALAHFEQWTPAVIKRDGSRLDNLKIRYNY